MTVMAVPLAETPLSALERHKQASQIQTEDEIKSFMETRFHEFEQNIRLRRLSGYYSSLASVLAHRYYEFQGDIRAYSLCFYYSILEHAFCPANRLREHNILTPGNRIIPLDFFSILTLISFNLRACQLYSEGRILGRRKYLRFWNHSYMLEAFKGIEYLARLYYLKADNKGIGQVFQKILVDSKLLDEEQAKALWEFRCGIAHRGTLYNVNNKKVFRFGYSWQPAGKCPLITRESYYNPLIQDGLKYHVNLSELASVFSQLKKFVHSKLIENATSYVVSPVFGEWVRFHWTQQYLSSPEEFHTNRDSEEAKAYQDTAQNLFDSGQMKQVEICRAVVTIPRWKVWRLHAQELREDLFSRIRDFLYPL